MKKTLFTLMVGLTASVAMADSAADSFSDLPAVSAKRLSGSMTVGYDTLGNDRGVVLSHSVVGGDGSPFAVLKYDYDFGAKNKWCFEGMVYYRDVTSGHTLYGNPTFGYDVVYNQAFAQLSALQTMNPAAYSAQFGSTPPSSVAAAQASQKSQQKVKQANCEPEIVFQNGMKYKRDKWNIAFGHTFIHGGILGVMAKHFRNQGASSLNEVYIRPEITPAEWMSIGCSVRRSISGIDGWWFEPDVTFKAPLYMEGDKVKVAAVAKFAMAATADYFDHTDSACNNGSQSYYIKLNTPWFVTDNFILTPGVGFHWLGKGAIHCNKRSKFAVATGNSTFVPFRNFAVVGSLSATYKF
ncbi:MAG: hypothetical protein MJ051_03435 [Akkermansia sp.]|nr:hypothetical protein [Akkermansia sp.]